jgi:chromosome segregation ATPase
MKKKRINLAEVFPKYFSASKRTEKFAELTDEQEVTLASVDSRIAELEEELEALKASQASEDDEDEDKKAADEDDEEMAAAEEDKDEAKKAKSPESVKIAALEAKLDKMMALLDKKPAADGTVITTDARSEGGGKAPKKMMSSVEQELNRLHGVK